MALNNYGRALGQLAKDSVKGSVKGFAMGIKGAALNEMPGLTAMYGLGREVKNRANKLSEASAIDASVKEQRTNNIISIEMVRQLRSINNNVLQQTRISALQANNAKQTAMFAEEQEREKAQRDKELLDAIKALKGGPGAAGVLGGAGGGGAGGKGFLGSLFDALQNRTLLEAIGVLAGGKYVLDKGKTIFGKGAGKVPTPTTGGTPSGGGSPPTGGGGKVIPFPPGGRGGGSLPTGGGGFGGGGGLLRGAGLAARFVAGGILRILTGPVGWALLAAEIGYEAYKIFGAQGGQGGRKLNFGGAGSSTTPIVEGAGGAAFGMYSKPGITAKGSFSQAKDSQAANINQSSQRVVKGTYGASAPGRFTSSDAPTKSLPINLSSSDESASKFIMGKEGFRTKAYSDAGKFAVGHGHSITAAEIKSGQIDLGNGEFIKVSGEGGKDTTVTREQADKLFAKDLAKYESIVVRAIGQEAYNKLSQNQKTAILSYAYNTGKVPDGFAKAIKAGNLAEAAATIRNGVATASGEKDQEKRKRIEAALKVRRKKEGDLFDTAGPATSEQRKAGVFTKTGGPVAPITPVGGLANEMETQNSIYRPTGSGARLVAPAVARVQVQDKDLAKLSADNLKVSRAVAKATVVAGGKSATENLKETQAKENKDRKYIRNANQTFLNQFQSTTQRLLSETLYKAIVVGAYGKEGSRNLVSKQEASGEGYRGGQLSNLLKLPSKTEKILTSAFGKKIGQAYAPMLSQLGTAYLEVGARQAGRGLFKGLFGTDDAAADSLTGQILGNFAKGNKQAATEQLLYGLTGVASGPETIFAKYGFNSSQQGTNFLGAYGAAQITAPLATMLDGKQPTYTGPYGKGTYGAGQTPMIQPMPTANQRGAYYTGMSPTGTETTFVSPAHMQAALAGDKAAQKELPHIGEGTWANHAQLKVAEKVATEQYLEAKADTAEYEVAQRARDQAMIRLQEESNRIAQTKPTAVGGGSSAGGTFMSNMGNFAFDLGTSLVANKLTQNIKNPYLKAFANYGITSAANQFIGKALFGGTTAATGATLAAGATPALFTGANFAQLGSSLFSSSGPGFASTAGTMLTNSGYTQSGIFMQGVQQGMNVTLAGATAPQAVGTAATAGQLVGEYLPYAQAIVYALKGDFKKAATTAAGTYAGMKAGAEIGAFIPGVGPVVGAAVGAVLGSIFGSSIGRKPKPAVLRLTPTSGNESSPVTTWIKDNPPEAYAKFADTILIALFNSAKLMQQQSGVAMPFSKIGIYVDSVSGISLWLYAEADPTNTSAPPKWSKNFGSIKDFKLGSALVGMIEYMRDCFKEGKDAITTDKLDKATADLKTKDITTITSGILSELKPGGQYDLTKGVGYNAGKPASTGFTVGKVGRYDSNTAITGATTTGTTTVGDVLKVAAAVPGMVGAVANTVANAITPSGTTTPAANLTASSSAQTTTLNNGTPINSVVAVGGSTENDNSTTVNNFNQMSMTADPWRQPAFNTGYQIYA